MSIFGIVFSNIKRRKAKTALLALGLLVGVATVIAIMGIVQAMKLELGDRVDEFGANVVILPRSDGVQLNYSGTRVSDVVFNVEKMTVNDLPLIDTIPERSSINIISPKIVGAVSAGGQNVLLVGLDSRREFTMKPWITLREQAGLLPGETPGSLALLELGEDQVILGASAARALGQSAGGQVVLNGRPFHVFGVLEAMGTSEDGLVFARLDVVQELLSRPGELSMIELSAYCNFCPIEDIVASLQKVLPYTRVNALRQAALVREETIERFSFFGKALSAVVLAVAAMTVLAAMLSAVNERTREIGIFRALGFRKAHVMAIFMLEAALVSLVSGPAGYILGNAAAKVAGPYLAQLSSPVPWRLDLIAPAVLLSVVLAVVSALYPAWKAAARDPAEALRFI